MTKVNVVLVADYVAKIATKGLEGPERERKDPKGNEGVRKGTKGSEREQRGP